MSTSQTGNTDGPSKAPAIDYNLTEAGEVTRTEKGDTIVIARYDRSTKIVRIVPEYARFRPAAIRFLNDTEVPVESILIGDDPVDKPKAGVVIPPKPKRDIQFGDKTPALVEWYAKYKPNEYRARYGIRGEGTVTKFRQEVNEKGEKVKVPYQVDAILADRKTHLTEKIEAGQVDDGDGAE